MGAGTVQYPQNNSVHDILYYHIYKWKLYDHLNRFRKSFWQNSTLIQLGDRGNISQQTLFMTHLYSLSYWWKAGSISSKIRLKTRIPALISSIQHGIGSPSHNNRQGIQLSREEVKLSLLVDDIITICRKY